MPSALTALTTSFCLDILRLEERQGLQLEYVTRIRGMVHVGAMLIFVLCTLLFRALNSTSVIDAIYVMASYTYGPLLGMFAYGLLCRRPLYDHWVPLVAIISPLVCYALSLIVPRLMGYQLGYEILILNGLLTALGLHLLSFRKSVPQQ